MSKDIKEKYERVCAIKDRAIGLIESQINGDISSVDAKELGEVADIAKDMAEVMKLCAESEYYHKITEAMDKNSDEDNKMYMDKYMPETAMYYTPMGMTTYARRRDSRGRYMYTEPVVNKMYSMEDYDYNPDYKDRMYYSTSSPSSRRSSSTNTSATMGSMNSDYARDYREGRSGMTRRTYMEHRDNAADKNTKIEDIKKYAVELVEDMDEMLKDASPEEKATMKSKLTTFVSKL